MKITILGRVPSKKNSKIISCRANRVAMFPSAKHKEWHEDATIQLDGIGRIDPNTPIIFTLYAPDLRAGDLSNKWESIADLFVDLGIFDDDNWFIVDDVRMKFGGVDRENPRVEIEY